MVLKVFADIKKQLKPKKKKKKIIISELSAFIHFTSALVWNTMGGILVPCLG